MQVLLPGESESELIDSGIEKTKDHGVMNRFHRHRFDSSARNRCMTLSQQGR
jgi:hypothetical protein